MTLHSSSFSFKPVNTYITSQDLQKQQQQQVLKEKLKVHIKHELDLGEKVISLLKQKKALEVNLQEQLNTKEDLEKKLKEAITSKKNLEQEFFQIQQKLREQQKSLRRQSRRIAETEEGSKEDLKTLSQELARLKQQFEILDQQKVEEHTQLSNKIKALSDKESYLKQELQTIAAQKKVAEEELLNAIRKLQELSLFHNSQKKQYQQQIKAFQQERVDLETRITRSRDERQKNEQKLQQEIESLKISKAQLEEKIAHLEQQSTNDTQDHDTELLQVIEKQDRFIQELKEKAYQRSTLLKAENETLKKKLENILASQEKITWENQMLESSLKGLQQDLVEYIQLKNKFEKAQREKEHFEAAFYKKIKFFEDRYTETPNLQKSPFIDRPQKEERQAEKTLQVEPETKSGKTLQSEDRKKSKLFRASWKGPGPRFVLAATVLISIMLAIAAYTQLPSYIVQMHRANVVLELPEDEFDQNVPGEIELVPGSGNESQNKQYQSMKETPTVQTETQREPSGKSSRKIVKNAQVPILSQVEGSQVEGSQAKGSEVEGKQVTGTEKQKKNTLGKPEHPGEIVVQLTGPQDDRFSPAEQRPFPTIENNIVLRRHHEQKLSTLRRY
jgi:hypothetical protein